MTWEAFVWAAKHSWVGLAIMVTLVAWIAFVLTRKERTVVIHEFDPHFFTRRVTLTEREYKERLRAEGKPLNLPPHRYHTWKGGSEGVGIE